MQDLSISLFESYHMVKLIAEFLQTSSSRSHGLMAGQLPALRSLPSSCGCRASVGCGARGVVALPRHGAAATSDDPLGLIQWEFDCKMGFE